MFPTKKTQVFFEKKVAKLPVFQVSDTGKIKIFGSFFYYDDFDQLFESEKKKRHFFFFFCPDDKKKKNGIDASPETFFFLDLQFKLFFMSLLK